MRRARTIVAIYMRGSGRCANVQLPSFAYRRRLTAGEDCLYTSTHTPCILHTAYCILQCYIYYGQIMLFRISTAGDQTRSKSIFVLFFVF